MSGEGASVARERASAIEQTSTPTAVDSASAGTQPIQSAACSAFELGEGGALTARGSRADSIGMPLKLPMLLAELETPGALSGLARRQAAEAAALASCAWPSTDGCSRWLLRRRLPSLRMVPSTRKPSRNVFRLLCPEMRSRS